MNIYITDENEKRLRQVQEQGNSMSGLINDLLDKYFVKQASKGDTK